MEILGAAGFLEFESLLRDNFRESINNSNFLFEVNLDKNKLWEIYIDSFPVEIRRVHDNHCEREMIKSIGNVGVIKNNMFIPIWDVKANTAVYQKAADCLCRYIKSRLTKDVYVVKIGKESII